MAGIYIHGMEMPPKRWNGFDITIYPDGSCISEDGLHYTAVPVPPHGDLIGRAALWVEINKICDRRDAGIITDLTCLQQLLSAFRHAPTIIPADLPVMYYPQVDGITPTLIYTDVYDKTEEVYGQYTDTGGTHSGEHKVKVEEGE